MDNTEFSACLEAACLKHPSWLAKEFMDSPCLPSDVHSFEVELGIKIPLEYVYFLTTYGGGYIGFVNVFSISKNSEWNVIDRNKELNKSDNFLAISDDETGGFYGFKVADSTCDEGIYYLDPDGSNELCMTHSSFFSYVLEAGLRLNLNDVEIK